MPRASTLSRDDENNNNTNGNSASSSPNPALRPRTHGNNNNNSGEAAPLMNRIQSTTSVGQGSARGSTRGSVVGRQYSSDYIDTGFDSREPGTRQSVHASDSGMEIHAAPDATVTTTFLNITCNIVGVGVLAIPTAVSNASLGFGLILIFLFQFFSSFSSYVLSVGCEYTQYYSQSQLLCHCLAGYADPNYWAELAQNEEQGGLEDIERHEAEQQINKSNADTSSSHGSNSKNNNHHVTNGSADYGAVLDDNASFNTPGAKSGNKLVKRTSTPGSSSPSRHPFAYDDADQQQQQTPPDSKNKNNNSNSDTAPLFPSEKVPTEEEVIVAEEAAIKSQRLVNLVLDLLLGVTYFGYTIAYSRVVADSMKNVSGDIGLPAFFRTRVCWLIIAGVVFLLLSMRRVFQEMKITSIIGIATIYFVILCIIIRLAKPDEAQPEPYSPEIRYWAIDGNFLNAFSTLSSAFGYQVNHPSFYQEMRDRSPGEMQKPVVTSMALVACTYALTGTVGYLTFGPMINDNKIGGDIVNGYSDNDILINVARVGLFAHFVCVFPLIVCAVRQCMHRAFLRMMGLHERADDPDEVFKVPFGIVAFEVVLVVLGSVILAGVVPGIDIVINFGGCLGGTFALMILPGIVGMYVFPEIERRLDAGDDTITPLISDAESNNFLGCLKVNFGYRTLYWLSVAVLVIGVGSTIGGFIVIINGL